MYIYNIMYVYIYIYIYIMHIHIIYIYIHVYIYIYIYNKACLAFLSAHKALGAEGQARWWSQQAVSEEEEQLAELSSALPRGGRVAPQLLDTFSPAAPGPTEALVRRLVASLGGGLGHALVVRGAIREALAAAGPRTTATFALERLDRRLEDVLRLWLSPALLQVRRVDAGSSPALRSAAAAVLRRTLPAAQAGALEEGAEAGHHRCYALVHAGMSAEGAEAPPLLVAHASLLGAPACSLAAAALPEPAGRAAACLWALGLPASVGGAPADALRSLGLGQVSMHA